MGNTTISKSKLVHFNNKDNGNANSTNTNSNKSEDELSLKQLKSLSTIQLFMKRYLSIKKKNALFKEKEEEVVKAIESNKNSYFSFLSKKQLRLRVNNLINDLIVRDDNSFIFSNHLEKIISLNNKQYLFNPQFPISFSNKYIFENSSDKNNQIGSDNDVNIIEFQEGFCYIGQFTLNYQINGFGSLVLPSNIVIKAVFVNGVAQSPAKIYYPDGLIYEGKVKLL